MCQSIAQGGRRCKTHEAEVAKKKLKKAQETGDAAAIKEATAEYLQTEEGIERLEEAGKDELAEKMRLLRNRKIELHNAHWGTNHKLMAPRSFRSRKKAPIYNLRGFDPKTGIHRETGTLYDPKGWDQKGHHRDTHTEFGPDGFNFLGHDAEGYDREGFKNGYDRRGLNRHGWDRDGFLPTGFHHRTMLDRDGYFADGFNKTGIHRETQQPWDPEGYSRDGYHHLTGISRETGLTYHEELVAQFGYHPENAPVSA